MYVHERENLCVSVCVRVCEMHYLQIVLISYFYSKCYVLK